MRVVVVDDEPLSRAHMESLLRAEEGVEVVSACGNAREAELAIAAHDPDALFLDIEMPGKSGLELARKADAAGRPLVVFVTAHQRYALDAFDVGPVDYVLKPADPLRCRRAVSRVSRVLEHRAFARRNHGVLMLNRLFAKKSDRLVHIPVTEIDVIEALGNYVKVHARATSHVLRASLSALESRLDPSIFVRTHRSFIVNFTRIRELIMISHGDYSVILNDGMSVPLSRVYRDKLQMLVLHAQSQDDGF